LALPIFHFSQSWLDITVNKQFNAKRCQILIRKHTKNIPSGQYGVFDQFINGQNIDISDKRIQNLELIQGNLGAIFCKLRPNHSGDIFQGKNAPKQRKMRPNGEISHNLVTLAPGHILANLFTEKATSKSLLLPQPG
jgi:hypothetical protein